MKNCTAFGWILVLIGTLLFFTHGRPEVPVGLIAAAALVYGLVCLTRHLDNATHGLK